MEEGIRACSGLKCVGIVTDFQYSDFLNSEVFRMTEFEVQPLVVLLLGMGREVCVHSMKRLALSAQSEIQVFFVEI